MDGNVGEVQGRLAARLNLQGCKPTILELSFDERFLTVVCRRMKPTMPTWTLCKISNVLS